MGLRKIEAILTEEETEQIKKIQLNSIEHKRFFGQESPTPEFVTWWEKKFGESYINVVNCRTIQEQGHPMKMITVLEE